MADGIRPETYHQQLVLPDDWSRMAFLVCWGLAFGSAILMAPWAIGLPFGVIGWGAAGYALSWFYRRLSPQRSFLRVDERGLTIGHRLAAAEHYPWERITGVTIADEQATIETTDGPVVLKADEVVGWYRLAQRVRSLLQGPEREAGATVPPAQVEGWLGVAPGGRLVCRGSVSPLVLVLVPLWLVVTGLVSAFYTPFFRGALSSPAFGLGGLLFTCAHAAIFFGVFSGGLLRAILTLLRRGTLSITADATGLVVRTPQGHRHYDWAELRGVTRANGGWEVRTELDELTIPGELPQAARLAKAIEAATAARHAGARLPRLGEVPAAALSPAEDEPTRLSLERGLSEADGTRADG